MFPERADRIVLDSSIGHTHLDRDGTRRYALGMEQTLPDFAKWAARRHDSYGLGRTAAQVRASYLAIAGALDKAPVAGTDGSRFRLLTFGHLFKQAQYAQPAQIWQALLEGDSGHGVYVLGDNSCALNATTRYLVEGDMPAKDTSGRAG
ncbi:alpha/beta hydrolase [Streptomyces sp. NPDC016675]|uniref:alpha/beta hydrolase n=1 Tax=Streptomyces sp. NPDC016675 TaxID=3364970 RepID=UPI0036F73C88